VASPSVLVQRLPRVGERIEPGTYAPNVNPDAVSVTITGSGWTLAADSEDLLFFEDPVGVSGVGLARITVVWTGPCPDDPTRLLGDRPKDLIDWVQSTPQLEASQLHSVIDLGLYGIGINATVLPHLTGPCGTRLPSRSWLWGVSGGSWNPNTGTRIFFEALYDGSRTLTVVFAAPDAAALSTFDTGPGRQLLASIGLRR
jgi:hypothetical protein